ncbi:unknown protein [Oryza sativa Japonica Group]|uniref:Os01g0961600 protein n=3 Tax=Oryza sativa TaxID=4530 RepID=A0A0P0VD63_ORYSJ|nr:uncharacterized protein LOC4324546 isoform X1 [Oryza sativa Japonica Group]XP_015616196.1 uncharacterized protein LOC4324546 isoform X1 [Oryza sativa Japonica Group]XP_015616207.1 uncharacterized protein LOC4324546 isoform X1 [Oryza sativa Japonica Group]EEC72213.1 hypothetical protein OsI_05306 [Oryza sativa Indica Group]EEE56050.1 hypothetical protein OsJ_04850 [Oryza sativa Japonica Group]KAF2954431.1 hypothetical protein DAI22_01g481600 [Oryza sativa Japonica Group]BAD87225.1 unknown p|eukprot:NP_001045474.2 Os01g0961600 [Oryza sativa Japonica Group]
MEGMLPSDPPGSDDDGNGTNMWTGQKDKLALDPCVSGDTNENAHACTSLTAVHQVLEESTNNTVHAMDMGVVTRQDDPLKASEEDINQHKDEQELWGPNVQTSQDDYFDYVKQLSPNSRRIDKWSLLSHDEMIEVKERHARYRIRFCKMLNKEFEDTMKDPAEYSRGELLKENYFLRYERDETLGWYFHPVHTWLAGLNDYQKLVLVNHDDSTEFLARDDYHSCFNTYEVDEDYVKYCEELPKKIKWIGDYVDLDRSSQEWSKMDNTTFFQALKIATNFCHMTVGLAQFAYMEYVWDLREISRLKEWPYFLHEIWKLVAKQKMNFNDALKVVYEMDMFHSFKFAVEAELNGDKLFGLEYRFSMCSKDISGDVEEGKALDLITKAVYREFHHTQTMCGYAAKKMDMAKKIGLV